MPQGRMSKDGGRGAGKVIRGEHPVCVRVCVCKNGVGKGGKSTQGEQKAPSGRISKGTVREWVRVVRGENPDRPACSVKVYDHTHTGKRYGERRLDLSGYKIYMYPY